MAQPTSRPPWSRTRSSIAVRSDSSFSASTRLQLGQDEAEHLLVLAALDEPAQRARDHPPGAGAAEQARDQPREHPPRAAILDRGEQPGQQRGDRLGGRPGRGRIGQEPP